MQNRNNLGSPSARPVASKVWAAAPQFCGPKLMNTGAHTCSDRWCSVWAFADSTARRSAAAASRARSTGSSALFNRDDSRPHHAILDRKIAARLSRRCHWFPTASRQRSFCETPTEFQNFAAKHGDRDATSWLTSSLRSARRCWRGGGRTKHDWTLPGFKATRAHSIEREHSVGWRVGLINETSDRAPNGNIS